MKVLIVAPFFFEQHRWMISAYKTALNLSRSMDVVVLTTGQPAFEQRNDHLRIYRMRDWFIPDPVNYSVVPSLAWSLWRVIRRERPDVYLVNKHMFFTSFAVPLLRLWGKRVILATDTFPGMNWFPRLAFVRLAMAVYAYVIGIPLLKLASEVVLFHEGLIPIARRLHLRYRVIHQGVDCDAIDAAPPATDLVKADGGLTVAYVGRLETVKGYDDYLAVAQSLAPDFPHVTFLLVGSTRGKEQLVRQVQSSQIRFLGHRDDVFSILKQLDVFVLPSYSEGLPNALMEAMAAGVACVSSAVGGVQALIRDGETGLMFQPGDRDGMRRQLVRLLTDLPYRSRLATAGREHVRTSFDWNRTSEQYLDVFQSVVTRA